MGLSDRLRDYESEQRIVQSRAIIAGVFVGLLLAGVLARLVVLQYVDFGHYTTLSDDNRVRLHAVPPTRGLIRDRDGRVLAENVPSYTLELVPERVDDLEETVAELRELVDISDDDVEGLRERWSQARPFESLPLKFRLNQDEVARLSVDLHRFPGVDIAADLTRHYPHGKVGAHAVGYVGRIDRGDLERLDGTRYRGTNHVGKVGAERQYESVLHGRPGFRQVEVNVQGRSLRVLDEEAPEPGADVDLTIDLELQEVAEEALGDDAGAVVALDPNNGEVLALASTPSFNPNMFAIGGGGELQRLLQTTPHRPLFNRALRGEYAPGSTVKPIVAMEALAEDVRDRDEDINCRGYYELPGSNRRYSDWKVHGPLDLGESIEQSCNVMFYDLAHELGIEELAGAYRAFGLGSRWGIDLPGERGGLVPDESWKRANFGEPFYPGETVLHGIGQGFMSATPVQLAGAASLFANRGRPVRPHVFAGVDDDAREPIRAQLPDLEPVGFGSADDWEYVVDAMVDVTRGDDGTARSLRWRSPNVIAGKTGTAQVYSRAPGVEEIEHEDQVYELRNHGLFLGFAPADEPEIAVGVVVEHGGGGAAAAAPVARAVIDAWLAEKRRERIRPLDFAAPETDDG